MKHSLAASIVAIPLMLGGCAGLTSFVNRVDPILRTACADAMAVANLAGLIPGVGAIVPYIHAGCATEAALVKLALDPSSTQWVGQQIGAIKALAAANGFRL